jgi:hypothetical protein
VRGCVPPWCPASSSGRGTGGVRERGVEDCVSPWRPAASSGRDEGGVRERVVGARVLLRRLRGTGTNGVWNSRRGSQRPGAASSGIDAGGVVGDRRGRRRGARRT